MVRTLAAAAAAATAVGAVAAKPPPAAIMTSSGTQRLGYFSYCWSSGGSAVCADYILPRCHDGRTPIIRVRRGEIVRFRLAFTPTRAEVAYPRGAGRPQRIAAVRRPAWRVRRAGVFILSVRTRAGDAGYAACVVFR